MGVWFLVRMDLKQKEGSNYWREGLRLGATLNGSPATAVFYHGFQYKSGGKTTRPQIVFAEFPRLPRGRADLKFGAAFGAFQVAKGYGLTYRSVRNIVVDSFPLWVNTLEETVAPEDETKDLTIALILPGGAESGPSETWVDPPAALLSPLSHRGKRWRFTYESYHRPNVFCFVRLMKREIEWGDFGRISMNPSSTR